MDVPPFQLICVSCCWKIIDRGGDLLCLFVVVVGWSAAVDGWRSNSNSSSSISSISISSSNSIRCFANWPRFLLFLYCDLLFPGRSVGRFICCFCILCHHHLPLSLPLLLCCCTSTTITTNYRTLSKFRRIVAIASTLTIIIYAYRYNR